MALNAVLTMQGEYITTVGTGTLEKDPIVTSEEPDKHKVRLRNIIHFVFGVMEFTTHTLTDQVFGNRPRVGYRPHVW